MLGIRSLTLLSCSPLIVGLAGVMIGGIELSTLLPDNSPPNPEIAELALAIMLVGFAYFAAVLAADWIILVIDMFLLYPL